MLPFFLRYFVHQTLPMKSNFFIYTCLSLTILLSGCNCKEKTGCLNPQATNYDSEATIADNCACKYDGVFTSCGIQNPTSIVIPPVQQETEVWCWLAVGEMIFRYYGLPTVNPGGDYQCGIVGAVGYSQNGACDACNINCGNCVRPAGSAAMVSYMLTTYPKVACRELYNQNRTLNNLFFSGYLSETNLVNELNLNRPVIAGINPGSQFVLPGNSQHVALIKGYYYDSGNNLILKINDPFPYYTTGFDPYVANGAIANGDLSYEMSYAAFVNGMLWNTSWYNIDWQ
jgi:Papain-like cysteine protease AvrRpt2